MDFLRRIIPVLSLCACVLLIFGCATLETEKRYYQTQQQALVMSVSDTELCYDGYGCRFCRILPFPVCELQKTEEFDVSGKYVQTLFAHTYCCGGALLNSVGMKQGDCRISFDFDGGCIAVNAEYKFFGAVVYVNNEICSLPPNNRTSECININTDFPPSPHLPGEKHTSRGTCNMEIMLTADAKIRMKKYKCGRIEAKILDIKPMIEKKIVRTDCVLAEKKRNGDKK